MINRFHRNGMGMFEEDRSDFGVPIAGFFIIGFASILAGIVLLNVDYNFVMVDGAWNTLAIIAGILGILTAAVAVKKAYLVEGFSFALFSVALLLTTTVGGLGIGNSTLTAVCLVLAFLFVAFMSYSGGVIDLAIVDAVLGIAFLLSFAFSDMHMAAAVLFLLAGLLSVYVCLSDWLFVQDLMMQYEEALCCDDECCCDNECQCGDGCDCEGECQCSEEASGEEKQ